MTVAAAKASLRAQLRQRRKAVPKAYRKAAARRLVRQYLRHRPLRNAAHVALYLPLGSELDTRPLMRALWARGVRLYAPRLARANRMRFMPLHPHTRCPRHAQGMRQPACGRPRRLGAMDLILLPLLGFDAQGNRLGQGGGYYDRALARLRGPRPLRAGLAFAAQALETVPHDQHDQPLHGVLTQARWQRF